jgi:hypothetical protein
MSDPNTLESILGLVPMNDPVPMTAPVTTPDPIDDDFESTRANIKTLLVNAQEALNGIMEVARQTNAPRAYEVAAALIKTTNEINRELLQSYKLKREAAGKLAETANTGVPGTTNIFLGTSKELLALVRKAREEMTASQPTVSVETTMVIDAEVIPAKANTDVSG